MKRKVAIQTGPKKLELIEEELPKLGPNDVLVRLTAMGLCHSDIPQFLGTAMGSTDHHGNRAMSSELNYPLYIGHEHVGVVAEVGAQVKGLAPGDYVGGPMSGFADYAITEPHRCIPIPKSVTPLKHCMVEPLTCVSNILQAASPKFGDYIAVIGCGVMGLLTLAGLRYSGAAELIAVDLSDERLALAKQYGATHCINAKNCSAEDAVFEITGGRGCDVVVEITGSLKGLLTATQLIRYAQLFGYEGRGKIVVPSLYGKAETWNPEIGYNLMYRSPILHNAHPWYCTDYRRTAEAGIDAYIKGILPINEMITHEFSLSDVQSGFDVLASGDLSYIKGIVTTD